jgi:hypothetical protein
MAKQRCPAWFGMFWHHPRLLLLVLWCPLMAVLNL